MDKCNEQFVKSLDFEYRDKIIEISSSPLANLVDTTIFKGIPIFGSLVSLYDVHDALTRRHRIKKIATFLVEIENNVESKKLEKYKQEILSRDAAFIEDLDFILLILDKLIEDSKAKYIGKLYKAFLDKKIDLNEFKSMSISLSQLLEYDIEFLSQYIITTLRDHPSNSDSISRLVAAGLIHENEQTLKIPTTLNEITIPPSDYIRYEPTPFGNKFIECITNY